GTPRDLGLAKVGQFGYSQLNERQSVPALIDLLSFGGRRSRGPHSDDLQHAWFVFGAVVMDFFSVVYDEASGWNGFEPSRIVFRASVDPPRPRQHRDVTVIRMKMWTTVVVRQPLL